jgi:LemA protein
MGAVAPRRGEESMRKFMAWLAASLAALALSGCGYNEFQSRDEQVKAAWSEVLNQYQRRADLIPNLVATVQGLPRRSATCSSA